MVLSIPNQYRFVVFKGNVFPLDPFFFVFILFHQEDMLRRKKHHHDMVMLDPKVKILN